MRLFAGSLSSRFDTVQSSGRQRTYRNSPIKRDLFDFNSQSCEKCGLNAPENYVQLRCLSVYPPSDIRGSAK